MANQIIYRKGKVSEIRIKHKHGNTETSYFKKGKDYYIKSDNLKKSIKARFIQLPSMIQRIFSAKNKKGVKALKKECASNFIKKTPAFNICLINSFTEI